MIQKLFTAAGEKPLGPIEPWGVLEDSRKIGLKRSILCEGLRRRQSFGANRIVVETDNG